MENISCFSDSEKGQNNIHNNVLLDQSCNFNVNNQNSSNNNNGQNLRCISPTQNNENFDIGVFLSEQQTSDLCYLDDREHHSESFQTSSESHEQAVEDRSTGQEIKSERESPVAYNTSQHQAPPTQGGYPAYVNAPTWGPVYVQDPHVYPPPPHSYPVGGPAHHPHYPYHPHPHPHPHYVHYYEPVLVMEPHLGGYATSQVYRPAYHLPRGSMPPFAPPHAPIVYQPSPSKPNTATTTSLPQVQVHNPHPTYPSQTVMSFEELEIYKQLDAQCATAVEQAKNKIAELNNLKKNLNVETQPLSSSTTKSNLGTISPQQQAFSFIPPFQQPPTTVNTPPHLEDTVCTPPQMPTLLKTSPTSTPVRTQQYFSPTVTPKQPQQQTCSVGLNLANIPSEQALEGINSANSMHQRDLVEQLLNKRKRAFYEGMKSLDDERASKKKHFLPTTAVQRLKDWFYEHLDHPYPSAEDKESLSKDTGLTYLQVSNWFTNTRKRVWAPSMKLLNKQQQLASLFGASSMLDSVGIDNHQAVTTSPQRQQAIEPVPTTSLYTTPPQQPIPQPPMTQATAKPTPSSIFPSCSIPVLSDDLISPAFPSLSPASISSLFVQHSNNNVSNSNPSNVIRPMVSKPFSNPTTTATATTSTTTASVWPNTSQVSC